MGQFSRADKTKQMKIEWTCTGPVAVKCFDKGLI